MKIEIWPISRPIPYARNARIIPQAAIDKVAGSISEFGFRQPIVVDKGGIIVAGHTRLLAAQKLGLQEVPVHVASELTPIQIKAYRLADNRVNQESSFDSELLALELADLKLEDFALELTGFNLDELAAMEALGNATSGGLTDEDAVPEPLCFPVTEPGDIWILGKHRLMCGDSTSLEAVQRLMAATQPAMLFTDIPYNVAFNGRSGDFEVIRNDDLPEDEFAEFLNAFANTLGALAIPETYQCCDWRLYPRLFDRFGCKALIVWAKNVFGMGRGYRHQHELIVYNGNFDSTTESDLWQIAKESSKYMHPTQKPVELPARAIQNSSRPGNLVLDLFAGSGSTLIACEKTRRKARLMELDPKYCDVMVKRWQDFTGQEAVLESNGRSFNELTAERNPESKLAAKKPARKKAA